MAEPYSQLFSGLSPPSDLGSFQQQGQILEQLRTDVANAPESGSIDAETGQITLGKPLKFNVYKYYDGTDLSQPYSIPDIATLVVQQLHRFPEGTTDKLRETMTDEEIITRLTLDPSTGELYRVPSVMEGAYEGLGRGFLDIAGGVAGAKTAAMLTGANPYATLGGFGLGMMGSSQLQSALYPDERPLPNRMNPIITSQFVSSSAGGAGLPYMVREGAMKEGFSRLVAPNIKAFKYLKPLTDLTGEAVETGFQTARRFPGLNLGVESSAIGSGAVLGSILAGEDSTPTMRRAAFETLGTVLNPIGLLQVPFTTVEGFRQMRGRLSETGREQGIADQLFQILESVETGDAAAVRNLLSEDSRLEQLLRARNIDVGNPTTAEKAGHPTLFALQNSQARRDPSGFGARVKTRASEQLKEMERLLASLIELDDPAALGLLDEARKNYFQASLEVDVARAYQQYEEALGTLTRGGENVDENALLAKIWSDSIAGAREQEKAFYARIPNEIESDAMNLMDASREIRDATQVGTQSVRLDAGQNPISIKVALRDFAEILYGEDDELADGINAVVKEIEDGPLPGLASGPFVPAPDGPDADAGRMPLPENITSGQLKNLHGVIVEAIKREKKGIGSQSILGQNLGVLEEAIRRDLGALPRVGPQVQRNLDNAIAFSEEFNNVFRNSFLGQNFMSRRNIPPEDLIRQILRQPPTRATMALDDANNAVTFLKDQLIEGTVPDTQMANRIMSGDFDIPADATLDQKAFYKELDQVGPRLNDLRLVQERGMRAFFRKHQKIGPDGKARPDHAAILTYLENPDNVALLERISPPVMINGERQSPLISDLQDTAKTSRLYDQTMKANNEVFNRAHGQIPLLAFMNKETGLGIRDVPGNAVSRLLGNPGSRPDDAITDFTEIARNVGNVTQKQLDELKVVDPDTKQEIPLSVRYSPEDLRESLFQTVLNQGFVEAGFESAGEVTPFSFRSLQDYMTKPITPGTAKGAYGQRSSRPAEGVRQPSPLDILRQEGVIEDTTFTNFKLLLDKAVGIEKALETGDADVIAQMFTENPITAELVERVVGAKLGTTAAQLLPGDMGSSSLIAASAGSQALRNLLDKTPSAAFQDLWKDVLSNPERMVEILDLGIERAEQGIKTPGLALDMADLPFAAKSVQILRAALLGTGAANLPTVNEIMMETFSGDIFSAPERPPTPGEQAGFRREQLRQQASPPPVAPPVAMTDQAQQFLPQMPSPQAPANPDTRAQFAAMYPNDITSSLIRTQQGIGSLLS